METQTNEKKEQLEFEDIKSELDAIVASLGEYNKNIPLDRLSDIVSLAKSYGIYDDLYKIYEISKDKDIAGAIATEVAKMGGAAAGVWAGMKLALLSPYPWTKNPWAITAFGAVGAFAGEAGVKAFEQEIREYSNKFLALFNNPSNLTPSDREGLAYQIANGDNTGVLYGAYNPSNSQVIFRDPLILDLNGDGVKTTSLQNSKTFFDLSGDGMSEQTGWVDSNDGLLVYDKNGNGKIDDISELFGNANQSGFSELKQLFDANNDNLIDDKDINFSQLKVWQDINGDGISQENELKSLDELGITSINLKSTSTNIDSNGNKIKATSTFTQNGEVKQIADVDFSSSKMLTNYTQDYTLTIDALILPWLRGYGTVKDAHILYSIDDSFVDFTKTFLQKDLKRSFIKFINNSRFYKADFLI